MFLVEVLVLLIIIVADLTSKAYIVGLLDVANGRGNIIELIPNVLELRYSENTGAGWSMLTGKTVLLIILTSICMVAVFIYLFLNKKDHKLFRYSLVFILAGGIGNLIDRIFFGYVRDFVYFKIIDFPIFNVADSFITIGGVLLFVYVLFFSAGDFKAEGNKTKQKQKTNEELNSEKAEEKAIEKISG